MKNLLIPALIGSGIYLIYSSSKKEQTQTTSNNTQTVDYKTELKNFFSSQSTQDEMDYLESKLSIMTLSDAQFFYEAIVLKKYGTPLTGEASVKFNTLSEQYNIFS